MKKKQQKDYVITMKDTRFTVEIKLIEGSSNMVVIVSYDKYRASKLVAAGDTEAAERASNTLRDILIKKLQLQGDESC